MPTLGFKAQFEEAIVSGTKRQTIRRERKTPIRPGDILYLHVHWRTPNARLILTATCTAVRPIQRMASGQWCYSRGPNGRPLPLSRLDLDELARRDGFRDGQEMDEWFSRQYGDEPLEDLRVIMWGPGGR